jgi:AsmA-like C-terminal region
MLPFAARPTAEPSRAIAIDRLNARGRLRVAAITLVTLRIEKLDAEAELRGRSMTLRGAQATFYGGHIAGDFEARLSAEPEYAFQAQIDRANLAALTSATESLAGRIAGSASGELRLSAQGVGRDNLLKSLEGEGTLRIREPVLTDLMPASLDPGSGATNVADEPAAGEGRFAATTASFHVGSGHIRVDPFSLVDRDEQFEVEGNIDFTRRLDLRVESMTRSADPVGDPVDDPAHDEWVGAGTLDAPRWTHQTRLAGATNGTAASRAHR